MDLPQELNIDKIYLINLEEAVDRREHFLKEIKRENISMDKIEIFKAIHGETYNFSDAELKMFKNANFLNSWVSSGCIGNQLSHYYVLKDMINKQYKRIIVFQDDVMLKNNFVKECNDVLNNCDFYFEIISIGLHKHGCYAHFVPFDINGVYETDYIGEKINEHVCILKNVNPYSLAYIVSLEGAKNIIKHLEDGNIVDPTDGTLNKYLIDRNLFFGSCKVLCTGNANFKSSIFIRNMKKSKRSKEIRRRIFSIQS